MHVIRYAFCLFIMLLLSFMIQQFLPTFTAFYNSRIFLILVVFLCLSVTVPMPLMLMFALMFGFLWDSQCVLGPDSGDSLIYDAPLENLRFGTSIILFGAMGALMNGIQPIFMRGKWYISAFITGIATFLYLLIEYLLIDFIRGSLTINRGVLIQISVTAAISVCLAPAVFFVLFRLARWCSHPIVEDRRKRRSRSRYT